MDNVNINTIAKIIYEAFTVLPFERQDIDFAVDKNRLSRGFVNEKDRFIAIYDRTYGSLRLSSHILQDNVLPAVLERAVMRNI